MADCKQTDTTGYFFSCPSPPRDSRPRLEGPALLHAEVAVALKACTDTQIISLSSPRIILHHYSMLDRGAFKEICAGTKSFQLNLGNPRLFLLTAENVKKKTLLPTQPDFNLARKQEG